MKKGSVAMKIIKLQNERARQGAAYRHLEMLAAMEERNALEKQEEKAYAIKDSAAQEPSDAAGDPIPEGIEPDREGAVGTGV